MNIAILSLGSGGTMGHMSLTTKLSSHLIQKNKIYLFSDHNYSDFSNIKNPKFKILKIPSQKHQKTVGGKLTYKYKKNLFSKLEENNIDIIIFSTFFDLEIVNHCKKVGIKTILVTYPLRDSHRQAIKLRKYYDLFDKVFTLKDIIHIEKISQKEEFVCPIKPKNPKSSKILKVQNILITCGGGGRPSSELFFKILTKTIKEINKKYPNINFTIITGNSKMRLKMSNSKIIKWSKDFSNLLLKSDIVISEAGYYTMLDLISMHKPAILIPGDRRIDNQELRAVNFQMKKMGWFLLPTENPSELVNLLEDLINNPSEINKMQKSFAKIEREIFGKETIDHAISKFSQ